MKRKKGRKNLEDLLSGPAMNRRHCLGLLGAGTGLGFGTLLGLDHLAGAGSEIECETNNPSDCYTAFTTKKLLFVFVKNGIRSLDFCDYHPAVDNLVSDFSGAPPMDWIGAEDTIGWKLPIPGCALQDHTDYMAIVRHVNMQTASHKIGQQLGLSGTTVSNAPAGSVVVANKLGHSPIAHLSFPNALPVGTLSSPVVYGEPADLATLLEIPSLTKANFPLLNSVLESALLADNESFAQKLTPNSLFEKWNSYSSLPAVLVEEAYSTTLDDASDHAANTLFNNLPQGSKINTSSKTALRFAAAHLALTEGISPVATVVVSTLEDGWFDTHTGLQTGQCTELAEMLDRVMRMLDMNQTTVVVMSDFDRQPLENLNGGTDHSLYGSIALFGGGITGGPNVIGNRGAYPGAINSDLGLGQEDGVYHNYTRAHIWSAIFQDFGLDPSDYFRTLATDTDGQIIVPQIFPGQTST